MEVSRRTALALVAAAALPTVKGPTGPPGGNRKRKRGPLQIASGGTTNYEVLVDTAEGPVVQNAAHELSQYLSQATGAVFTVVNAPTSGREQIVVGTEHPLAAAVAGQVDFDALHEDGFILRTDGDTIFIAGAIARGTLYGAYWFLDRLVGVRWFAPDTTSVPSISNLKIERGLLNADHAPRFRFRELIAATANDFHYRQHNMMNGPTGYLDIPSQPGINTWSDYWAEHVWDGKSHHEVVTDPSYWSGSALLMMSPQMRTAAVDALELKAASLIADGYRPHLAFDQADGYWVPDSASLAFANAHGGALAAPMLDAVNEIADRVALSVPDAVIETQAYLWSHIPPTGMTARNNVQITVASLYCDRGRPFFSNDNAYSRDNLLGWAGLANDIVVWTYSTNFSNELVPYPNTYQLAADVKDLATVDAVRGYFGNEAYYTRGAQQVFMRQWVMGRMLWDPSQDVALLMQEFCDGYYGPAGTYVFQYLEALRAGFLATPYILGSQGPSAAYLDATTVAACDSLLDSAQAAAVGSALYSDHVRHIRMPLDYVILLRGEEFVATMGVAGVDRTNRLARFEAALAAAGMQRYAEPGGNTPARASALAAITRTIPSVPAVVGTGSQQWVEAQEHSVTIWGAAATPVADALASNGAALRCGGAEQSVLQYQLDALPVGSAEWDVYVSVRVDTSATDPTTRAVIIGTSGNPNARPDGYWEIPLGDVIPGQYTEIKIPGVFVHDPSEVVYVAPPGVATIDDFSVDRFFAVRR